MTTAHNSEKLGSPSGYICHACGGERGTMTLMEEGWEHDEPIYCAWADRDRLREAFEEYASHASWRCGHPDRYPWEPDCPCGLTKACRDFGIETHND